MYKDILFLDGIQSDFLQSIEKFIEEWESELSYIEVSTSGSTGVPKVVRLDKDDVIASAKATGAFFRFAKGDCMLLNLSPDYIAGKLMIVRAIVHDMKIIVVPLKGNPLDMLQEFPEKISFAAFVPAQVECILDDKTSRGLYEEIENVIIGGAEINNKLEVKIQRLKNNNFASFGMTESITHFALRNISDGDGVYKCLEGVKIKSDYRSCLILCQLFSKDCDIQSNDMIALLSETAFKWIGRIDNIINSGGIKLNPETIEKEIESFLPSRRFYVSAIKDNEFGKKPVLVLEGGSCLSRMKKFF